MKDERPPLAVGDKLWFVPSFRPGTSREVEAVKVGRKWATVADDGCEFRVEMKELAANGWVLCQAGQCWTSREAYEEHRSVAALWLGFRRAIFMKSSVPPVGAAQIRQAAELLGVKLDG